MSGFFPPLQRMTDVVQEEATQKVRTIALKALRGVVLRSPVGNPDLWKGGPASAPAGYSGGRFRSSWVVSIGSPSDDVSPEDKTDPVGGTTISDGARIAQQAAFGTDVYVQNNLPYSVRLENGWSLQAPAGMVALTMLELRNA